MGDWSSSTSTTQPDDSEESWALEWSTLSKFSEDVEPCNAQNGSTVSTFSAEHPWHCDVKTPEPLSPQYDMARNSHGQGPVATRHAGSCNICECSLPEGIS